MSEHLGGQEAARERADHAEHDREDDPHALPSRLQQSREDAHEQSPDDPGDDAHGAKLQRRNLLAGYSITHRDDVPDVSGDYPGEMRMATEHIGAEQVALHLPPDACPAPAARAATATATGPRRRSSS